MMPVRFGLGGVGTVDVEVTWLSGWSRRVKKVERVDPSAFMGRALTIVVGS
jgi:hypothetical protein